MEQTPANDSSDDPREFESGCGDPDDARGSVPSADTTSAGGAMPWDAGVVVDTYLYDVQGNLISHTRDDPSTDTTCPDCSGTGVVTLLTTQKFCARCSGTGNAPA